MAAAAPSPAHTVPSVGCLSPPLLSLNAWLPCGASICPPHLVKPTAWDHVCVFVHAEDVLQSCGRIPVKRCMTLKQGEKLTLPIHLQERGADLSRPTAGARSC